MKVQRLVFVFCVAFITLTNVSLARRSNTKVRLTAKPSVRDQAVWRHEVEVLPQLTPWPMVRLPAVTTKIRARFPNGCGNDNYAAALYNNPLMLEASTTILVTGCAKIQGTITEMIVQWKILKRYPEAIRVKIESYEWVFSENKMVFWRRRIMTMPSEAFAKMLWDLQR
jgi:hypothetical protein